MKGNLKEITICFDTKGSLATTHDSQGSDMGLFGGLLGWDAHDERMEDSRQALEDTGAAIDFLIGEYHDPHPCTYKLKLTNPDESHEMIAISSGGGMIEVIEIDGAELSMAGDYYETLVYIDDRHDMDAVLGFLEENVPADDITPCLTGEGKGRKGFIEIKAQSFPGKDILEQLNTKFQIPMASIKQLNPVLPVLSRSDLKVPFITCDEMLAYNEDKNLELWELGAEYESIRGNISTEEVLNKMIEIVRIMRRSLRDGLAGKDADYKDRLLGFQCGTFSEKMERGQLLEGGMLNRMILYTTAMMEVKSSMGVIVAAPTAGACGTLPGACFGAADTLGLDEEEIAKAMLAAGLIGVFISAHATFAAEVGGCQAECGSASGMSVAALVTMAKGTVKQAIHGVSMSLQNIFGMVCDPVAKRVEVPCLGKNVMAASNALACANMGLADFDAVVLLDEVIATMDVIGRNIPCELRCTGLGGLSATKTSQELEEKLMADANRIVIPPRVEKPTAESDTANSFFGPNEDSFEEF